MINLGTCSDTDFEAQKAALLARFRASYGSDYAPTGDASDNLAAGTISRSQRPLAVMSYNPPSWWTARGSLAKRRLMERRGLPSFKGWLFVTLTVRRRFDLEHPLAHYFEDPEAAYLDGKEKLRRTIWRLKNDFGYEFEKYCWKLEFHQPDAQGRIYPHWHLLIKCRSYMHKEHVEAAWGLGHADAKRVRTDKNLQSKGFGYVFKYAAKTIENIPDYVLDSDKRLRAWQTSKGFYKNSGTRTGSAKKTRASLRPLQSAASCGNTQNAASSFFDEETSGEKTEAATGAGSSVSVRQRVTLRDRLERHSRTCVVISHTKSGPRFRAFPLTCAWSRVPLNFWAYASKHRPDLMASDGFSVCASSVQFPDDELFLRLPIACAGDSRAVELEAVTADENPF